MNKAWDDSAETTSLLQLAGQGNDDAFKALMDRHLQPVRKSVRRRLKPQLRPRIDPSDVIQETQEKAFRELPDFLDRRPMPFRLWLLKTAHQRIVSIGSLGPFSTKDIGENPARHTEPAVFVPCRGRTQTHSRRIRCRAGPRVEAS